MKARKLLCLLALPVFLNVSGCEKSDIAGDDVSPCSTSATDNFDLVGELTNVEGQVVTLNNLFPDGQFFIGVSSPIQNSGFRRLPLGVCNLPKSFQRDKLRIQFSGHLLWYKQTGSGIEIDVSTQPFELTRISNSAVQE